MGLLRKFRSSTGTNLQHGSSDVLQSPTARVTFSYIGCAAPTANSQEENHIMSDTAVSTEITEANPAKLTIVPAIRSLVPPLTDDERAALAADITEKGGLLVPVLIDQDGNVLDGHNRTEIAIELGLENIPVTVVEVKDEDDAKRIAIEGNLNRRHLTLQARKKIARQLVKLTPWKSNRQLAKAAGIDPKTVGSIREELESGGEVPPQDATVGEDGKTRTTTRKPSASKESTESKVTEALRAASSHVSVYIKDIEKLTGRKQAQLTPEAFVANLKGAARTKMATDRLPAVISFLEEALHLLEDEAATKADGEKSNGVSAPEPGAAAPSQPEGDDAPF